MKNVHFQLWTSFNSKLKSNLIEKTSFISSTGPIGFGLVVKCKNECVEKGIKQLSLYMTTIFKQN